MHAADRDISAHHGVSMCEPDYPCMQAEEALKQSMEDAQLSAEQAADGEAAAQHTQTLLYSPPKLRSKRSGTEPAGKEVPAALQQVWLACLLSRSKAVWLLG